MSDSSVGWDTPGEAGLLDNYEFTITQAHFAPDASYADGNVTILQLEGQTDDADTPEHHLWYPTGKGWHSEDGGKSIIHDSGKADKFFVKTSLMYRLINRCVEDFGLLDLLKLRGGPLESKVWIGLKFQIKREEIEFGGNFTPINKEMPVAFLGVVAGPGADGAAAAPAAAPVAQAPVAAAPAAKTPAQILADKAAAAAAPAATGTVRDQVIALALSIDDPQAFQDAALQVEGIGEDDDLIGELVDSAAFIAAARAAQ